MATSKTINVLFIGYEQLVSLLKLLFFSALVAFSLAEESDRLKAGSFLLWCNKTFYGGDTFIASQTKMSLFDIQDRPDESSKTEPDIFRI